MKRITALITAFLMIAIFSCSGCSQTDTGIASDGIKSYAAIPGITKEEISAVETLINEKRVFSYGQLIGSESFMLPDGTYAGFTTELCKLLSDLFGIDFEQLYYDEWDSLKADIDSQTLDFSSLSVQGTDYFVTKPISGRGLKIYTLAGNMPFTSESDADGLRIGFLSGTSTADLVKSTYPELTFSVIETANCGSAVELLNENIIDAFVMTEEKGEQLLSHDFIRSQDFFPAAYCPVSIATSNDDLEPVISIINKYLVNGGSGKLFELYSDGKYAYKRYQLLLTLTDEEKLYLEGLKSLNAKANIGIQHDVYPVSFYNETEKQYEGIVIDVLSEITKLTGIGFVTATTTTDTPLSEILAKLKTGEISMMTQLLYTDSRKNDYLWSAVPYLTSNYALLSKSSLPNLENYQVYYKKVGTVNKSAHEEMFNRWFPGHNNRIAYSTTTEGFDALESGEIDLLMLSESMLLTLTNYREKADYKVNISFNEAMDSLLGFSKNDAVLCSIVDKALAHVNISKISNGWLTRNFDYSRKADSMQIVYLSVFSLAAVALLVATFFMFQKNKHMGKSLQERTARLSAIYSSIPDTVFTKNTEGVYTSCSPSFERQAGRPESEIIGKTYAEVFKGRVSETIGRYSEIDKRVLRERSSETVEEAAIFPDGSIKLLETIKVPLIQNGIVVGLLGIGRDVTERKEIEAELQQVLVSAQDAVIMFEHIINTAQIAFAMTMDNIITQVNEYSSNYIGMNTGDDIRSFYTDAEQRKEIIDRLEYESMISNIIIKLNIASGESHRFLASVASFQYEQRKAFIIWAMDIEDGELKNDQIRAMQESLQTVLDTLPVPIRIFDMETTDIVYANDSLLELLEYGSADELDGLKMTDILAEKQGTGMVASDCVNEVRNSVRITDKPVAFERDYRTKAGRTIETQVVTRLINYKGKPSSIGILKDLTEEKERAQFLLNAAEREREANQYKSRFLANMSHEIRTPMNAIIGMSELLLNETLTSRQQGYVNDINLSSHSLLSIINDILDLSKIEAGKLELIPVNYDFHVFIDNISSMFQFVSQKKGLEFKIEMNGDIPKYLFGDDVRLRQVLTNICGNAVKFTNSGYISLKISAADNTLTFEVEDTGVGIRAEDLPKLFEAFVQADTQKNRSIRGTGLGLSISKAFVEMMNGAITVDSEYGQGTVFTVTIPKVLGDESLVQSREESGGLKSFFAPSARVLVVDDNELNLKVACGLLNLYQINVDIAQSGIEAIELVKKTDYDIVFMDHMMPEMDGIEATDEIRKLGGRHRELIIIALTANAVRGAKELFMSTGFNDFLSKPIEMEGLVSILTEWLPKEKIEIQSEPLPRKRESKGNERFLDSVKKINGINTEIGLSRISGMEDMYRDTIEVFTRKLLSECDKLEGFLSNEDLRNFAISVHGMKSSLAAIGAMHLSEMAFILETASKNEELSYCEEHLPDFLKNLRFLHEQLSAIMPKDEDAAARPEGDVEYLRENVLAALEAINNYDSDLAEQTLGLLTGYNFGEPVNALLKNAAGELEDFEFETAAVSLNSIISCLK